MYLINKSIHCLHTLYLYIVEIQGSAAWAVALKYIYIYMYPYMNSDSSLNTEKTELNLSQKNIPISMFFAGWPEIKDVAR